MVQDPRAGTVRRPARPDPCPAHQRPALVGGGCAGCDPVADLDRDRRFPLCPPHLWRRSWGLSGSICRLVGSALLVAGGVLGCRTAGRRFSGGAALNAQGQRTSGGNDIRIASTLPPVIRPNLVPRS